MKTIGVILLAGLACFAIILLWPEPYEEPGLHQILAAEDAGSPLQTADRDN